MLPFCLFGATGDAVARLDSVDGASVQTTIVLGGEQQSREGHIVNGVMCCLIHGSFLMPPVIGCLEGPR